MSHLKPLFKTIIFSSLILGSSTLLASSKDVILGGSEDTAYSYHRAESFCANGAEDMMSELNEINKVKFDKINAYKLELKNLAAYDNLLSQATAIKDRYEKSLNAIVNPTDKKADHLEKLGQVRSVLKNAVTINALMMLIKKQDNKLQVPEVFTMASLCKDNEDEIICKDKSLGSKNNLDTILKNFQNLASDLPAKDREKLKVDVKKVMATIPNTIAPIAILDLLSNDSPNLKELLTNAESKNQVSECLSETADQKSLTACEKLIGNVKTKNERQVLLDTISKESNIFSGDLQKYNKIIAVATEDNKSDFEKALDSYDATNDYNSNKKAIFTDASKLLVDASKQIDTLNAAKKSAIEKMQTNRNPATVSSDQEMKESLEMNETRLDGVENFFYEKPTSTTLVAQGLNLSNPSDADKIKALQNVAIKKAKTDAEKFKNVCDFSKETPSDEPKFKECQGLMRKVIPQIDAAKTRQAQQIRKIADELKELNDKDFKDAENLKEYLAEKYLCACNKKNNAKITEENLVIPTCSSPVMTLSSIDGLSNSSGIIAKTLYYNKIKVPMDNGSCSMSSAELDKFTESCKNSNLNAKSAKKICDSITGELKVKEEVRVENVRRDRKLEKLNEENYVTYDARSPSGYKVTKKKSTGRIIAEGMAPAIPMLLPAFLGNWQTKMNIDMMTNQALYQKQMLHTYDVYNQNPWMYSYNYFGLSPYMNTIGTSATTSKGTSTLPSTGIGAGFNFGI